MSKLLIAILLACGVASVAQASGWYGEQAYLQCNDDVRNAVYSGQFRSGYEHYVLHGQYERRLTDGGCFAWNAPGWFNERGYLNCNHDVLRAVRYGQFKSGWHHFRVFGQYENRQMNCY
jgi:hypothetical protein